MTPSPTLPASPPPWQPEPLIEWLLQVGRLLSDAGELTGQLAQRLHDLGAPVTRMRISLRTLNPLVVGRAYTWTRGAAKVEEYNPPHSIVHSADYLGSPIQAVQQTGQSFRCRLARTAPGSQHSSLEALRGQGTTDYLALALAFNQDPIACPWMLSTDAPEGFSDEDVEKLNRLANALAPVLEVHALKMTTRSLLDTYLGHRTGQRVFDGQVRRGDGEVIEAAIWYSDVRDSTRITEALPLEQLLELINRHFQVISDAVGAEGGEVLRFIGDALLVVFASGPQRTLAQACEAALRAARSAAREMAEANRAFEVQGLPRIHYGLGLDVGQVIYGNVGARDRLDFTVMGSAVNRAARIERLTKATGWPALASRPFAQLLSDPLAFAGEHPVAGMIEPLPVYVLPAAACGAQSPT